MKDDEIQNTETPQIATPCGSVVSCSDRRLVRNFWSDYERIREIWGQIDNWKFLGNGKEPLAVRAWDGLLAAAVASINDGSFDERANIVLESAKLEYEMRLAASFRIIANY